MEPTEKDNSQNADLEKRKEVVAEYVGKQKAEAKKNAVGCFIIAAICAYFFCKLFVQEEPSLLLLLGLMVVFLITFFSGIGSICADLAKAKEKEKLLDTDIEKIEQEIEMVKENQRKSEEHQKELIEQQKALQEKRHEFDHPECPMCKSRNTRKISTANRVISVSVFGLASSKIGKQYECLGCGHKW